MQLEHVVIWKSSNSKPFFQGSQTGVFLKPLILSYSSNYKSMRDQFVIRYKCHYFSSEHIWSDCLFLWLLGATARFDDKLLLSLGICITSDALKTLSSEKELSALFQLSPSKSWASCLLCLNEQSYLQLLCSGCSFTILKNALQHGRDQNTGLKS